MRRWAALALFVVVLVSPALRDRDSFPLSTQPMYAHDRGRVAELATVVGRDRDGRLVRLSLGAIADTDDPLIAQSTARDAIRRGDADELCRTVAGRVRDRDGLVRVEVVRERVDVVAMADGSQPVGRLTVVASCPVVP